MTVAVRVLVAVWAHVRVSEVGMLISVPMVKLKDQLSVSQAFEMTFVGFS